MFCFRSESYVKLHRIDQCIPEMSSIKEENAKWKINIKQEPGCPLHTKSDGKIKKEPGCPLHTKSDVKVKKEPGCPLHTKSDVKIKQEPGCPLLTKFDVKIKKEPGCENEKPLKHDPGYTPAHDLSVVHDLTMIADDDGDGDVDLSEKIIKTEPDDSDGKTDEKCKSKEKRTCE